MKQGYSVWMGALARVDFLSGSEKYFTFFLPQEVTLHRTPFERAQEIYDDKAGTLLRPTYHELPEDIEFERREISLQCDDWKEANYDIVIEGLGWFSIQGKGFVNLFLNVPFGIPHHIRESPIRPFEVQDKGLQKYTGQTLRANSRKNRALSEKFKQKRKGR
mmetsp:Transcript_15942/g.24659  ORF Transcript_15942/g.24659 Transcript_15942/m.24659 type:complete len:162 (-) Transcript_15942:11-496(-)